MGGDPAWVKYGQIVGLWLVTPFAGGGAAYATARLLQADRVPATASLPALAGGVGLVIANIEFVGLGPPGEGGSLAGEAVTTIPTLGILAEIGASVLVALVTAGAVWRLVLVDERAAQQYFLLALGGLVAFSAGGSQVGLAVGPLLPLLDDSGIPLVAILFGGGLGLLVGSWTGAPRMIKAIAQDYSSLSPRRSIAALIPSFVIAQIAIAYGIPVSFNEIVVSAVVGSGYAGAGGVSARKVRNTVTAWAGSLVLSAAAGYAIFRALSLLL